MPDTLTAADFSRLRLRWGAEPAPEELPAAIEHDFEGGRMVDHYLVTPAPALLAQAEVQALGGIAGVQFLQQPEGAPWQIVLRAAATDTPAVFEMEDAEFRALLDANGVILPGEPGFVPPST